jgi:hypothetical protein
VRSATSNRLVVAVPAGATTGPISVATPLGSASSGRAFKVLGSTLTVAPVVDEVQAGLARQFTASEGDTPTASVRWAVNGMTGGDASVGTISAGGLYAAPARIPSPPRVTITATHEDDPSLEASARVTILAAGAMHRVSNAISVALGAAPAVVDKSLTTALSVQLGAQSTPLFTAGAQLTVEPDGSATAFASTAPISVAITDIVPAVDVVPAR